jgi:uncharacterized membrane protein HdeD (DUF308 family)
MFKKWRYKTAFFFGRKEHFFSRVLFVCLLITLGLFYLSIFSAVKILLFIDIGLWILYWGAHRLEKLAHPNH